MATEFLWDTEPRLWPKAARGYVFLAAAFGEVGKALHGEDWTGNEALAPPTPFQDRLRSITNIMAAQRVPPPVVSVSRWSIPARPVSKPFELSPDVAERARASLEQLKSDAAAEAEAVKLVIERRLTVAEWIAERARNGDLPTFGLWVGGGLDPIPLPASVWNVTSNWNLFAGCAVSYARQWPSTSRYFLFLERESLDRCLVAVSRRQATPSPHAHPSSLKEQDAPLIEEMRVLIQAGEASGPYAAALRVVDRAGGGGSTESRARRLERRFNGK